mgnify:CR=1 FL=1
MIEWTLKKIIGTKNEREVKRLMPQALTAIVVVAPRPARMTIGSARK